VKSDRDDRAPLPALTHRTVDRLRLRSSNAAAFTSGVTL
jgi:hypothetical protein